MKQVITYTLLFTLIIQFFWGSGLLMDYYVNSEIYKENCENKNRPELNCDGKCILAQKILNSQKEEEGDAFWSPISFEYISSFEHTELSNTYYIHDHLFGWSSTYRIILDADIFKPPV